MGDVFVHLGPIEIAGGRRTGNPGAEKFVGDVAISINVPPDRSAHVHSWPTGRTEERKSKTEREACQKMDWGGGK